MWERNKVEIHFRDLKVPSSTNRFGQGFGLDAIAPPEPELEEAALTVQRHEKFFVTHPSLLQH